jgi:pyridoxine 5-phosphate synthase
MTKLSVNINKIALLRNSRGRNYPDVGAFAARCLSLGAHGITLHPRPDQRHARYTDVAELYAVCKQRNAELNVEGYPSAEFLEVVKRVCPTQCTLVPDDAQQLTSDHGWNIGQHRDKLRRAIAELHDVGVRVSLFVDYDCSEMALAKQIGADRIELYTEPYAASYGTERDRVVFDAYRKSAESAHKAGLGVNAGHDLSLQNLPPFLEIPNVLEVSIGHALITEAIELGIETTITRYLEIVRGDGSLEAQRKPA